MAVELDISKLASGDLKKDLLALKVREGKGRGGGIFLLALEYLGWSYLCSFLKCLI